MQLNFRLTTPIKEIERLMLVAIAEEYNSKLQLIADIVQAKIAFLIVEKIKNSDIYRELVNGKLKTEFGLVDAEQRVQAVISKWVSSISFKLDTVKPKARTVSGGFRIMAIASDFNDVIQLAEATLFANGGEVPWLRWLLLDGYKNLIADYTIQYGNYARSRTGTALMRRSSSKYYKVPTEFAGLYGDNWITKLFDNIDAEIEQIMINAISGVL